MAASDDSTPTFGDERPDDARRKVFVTRRERRHDGFLRIDAVSFRRTALTRAGDAHGMLESAHPHEVMERGDSVAVLVHDTGRDVVFLAEQFRIAAFERGTSWTSAPDASGDGLGWLREIVAGGVDPGETPVASARREVLEEIGYRVDRLDFIGRVYLSPGGASERLFLYYAPVTGADRVADPASGEAESESDEDILRVELPAAAFMAALDDGLIEDAKTLIAAQWFARHKARRTG